ncbi:hypothetical protein HY546_01855 [archaeon]|nr:hypothetical protein [archaeon]
MNDEDAKKRVAIKLRNQAMDWFSKYQSEFNVRRVSVPLRPYTSARREEVTILNDPPEQHSNPPLPEMAEPAPEAEAKQPTETPTETPPAPAIQEEKEPELEQPAGQTKQEQELEEQATNPQPASEMPLIEIVDAPEEKSKEQEVQLVRDLKQAVEASPLGEERKRVFGEILGRMEKNLASGEDVYSLPSFARNLHSKPELCDAVEHVLKKYALNSQPYFYLWGLG